MTEDNGVIGLGVTGEREFSRRHFSDLVVAFSSPLILTVLHGPLELGSVHPASLTRPPGDAAPILLLGGRSWKVVEVDWSRRRVYVTRRRERRPIPLARYGPYASLLDRSRPGADCRRDGPRHTLPLVSDGRGEVTAWLFAGGIVSASLARVVRQSGISTAVWDGVSVTARTSETDILSRALSLVDPATAHPELPAGMATALKFGLYLPAHVAAAVLIARNSKPEEVAAAMARPQRRISAPGPGAL